MRVRWLRLVVACLCLFSAVFPLSSCSKSEKVATVYEITVEYSPENATLAGTEKVTFENGTENVLEELVFQLYPNAYRREAKSKAVSDGYYTEAYYAGESYGEMVVFSVNGAKSWEVTGEDCNLLSVALPEGLYPGEKTVLDIGFLLKLANVNHRTGVTAHTVNLGNFYPTLCGMKNGAFYPTAYYAVGDPFYTQTADYKISLTLPKEYGLAATGSIARERSLESKKEYLITASSVRDFAIVLSKGFKTLEKEMDGDTVAYHYYQDDNPKRTLETAAEAFAFFEKTYGEYPYPRYELVQTGFCQGSMEYPRLSMLSDSLQGDELTRAVVRETAHQWWYAVVGSDQIENAWQDEGLAEYSAIVFFERYEKYGLTREALTRAALMEYRSYYDIYGSVLGRTDTKMVRHLKDFLSEYEYKCLAYDKPVVMFDTLRKSVGDKDFFSALKRYYKENRYKLASPHALIGAFERTGVDAAGFFDSFLQGKAIL